MPRSEYDWELGSPPPVIKLHSLVKHEIIHAYVAKYISILAANPAQRQLRLTLVDGFAGGGLYLREDSKEEHVQLTGHFHCVSLPAGADRRILPQFDNDKDLFMAVLEAFRGFDRCP